MPQIKLLNQYAQANPSTGCDRSDCCNNQLKKQQSRKRGHAARLPRRRAALPCSAFSTSPVFPATGHPAQKYTDNSLRSPRSANILFILFIIDVFCSNDMKMTGFLVSAFALTTQPFYKIGDLRRVLDCWSRLETRVYVHARKHGMRYHPDSVSVFRTYASAQQERRLA